MKRVIHVLLTIIITLCLTSCGQSAPTWQEQYDLGMRYLSEGNYEEAIIAFTAAIEIDPNRAVAYEGRGDAYIGSGETEENLTAALADYEAAVALDETNAAAWLGLANVYIRKMDYDFAIEVLGRGYEVTGSQEILDLCEYLEEIAGDQWLFTDDMIRASELTIAGTPFWELSIEQLAESFPSDEEFRNYSWIISEDRIQYTQVHDSENILSAQQENGSQGLDSLALWGYSELRDISFRDDLTAILKKLGISAEGIENANALAAQGQQITFVNRNTIWSKNEHAGSISPGSRVDFIWVRNNPSQDLFLEFDFDEDGNLIRILYQLTDFD